MKRALALMIWAVSIPLFAQNAVTITNYSGDQSAGSFAGSVSALNGTGSAGDLVFQISPNGGGVTLSGATSVFSQSTSFIGETGTSSPGVNLVGATSAESTLLFQNGFYLGPNMALNLSDQGAGLNAGITAAFIYMDSGSGSGTKAGDGGFLSTSGGANLTGNAGGEAFWQASAVTMNSIIGGNILGGTGGAVTDVGGTGDSGGAGGEVLLQTGAWSLSGSSNYSITGGAGGAVSDASGSIGGAGGSVSLSVGSWSDTDSSGIRINGGAGQAGSTGGAGGAVTAVSGLMTVAGSNWILKGGVGGAGDLAGGAGGAVSVSWSALNETQGAGINISSGNGGAGGSTGGAGGNLATSGVSILESGSASNLNLSGGTGGAGGSGTGGKGGSAAMTMVSVQLSSSTGMALLGGNGGSSSSAAGGNGGNALVSIGAIDIEGGSGLSLVAGSGGSGASGGNGGDAQVLAGSVTLDTGGNLSLKGGDAGSPGGLAGGVGVGFQDTFIGTGSTLNLVSGSSNGGPVGSVVASLATLEGTGDIVISGQGSVLQVGSGSFGGVISGTEALVQTSSSGALTVSGDNVYSGGTTVSGSLLAVDTGGSLGSGGIFVQAAKELDYFDSATAGFSAVTADGSVSFIDQSSAGAATLTLNGTGSADFSNTAQGGTARFVLNGGLLDISASGAGVVTVGSIEGTGSVSLGQEGLAVGSNGVSTSYSGTIFDSPVTMGGFLEKVGSGALTLVGGDNSYTGGTLIEQGNLVLGDPFTVSAGVTSAANFNYLGTGSVSLMGGQLSMAGSADSAVSLNVGGDYVQNAGATLQLGIYGGGAEDQIGVGGAATLSGTLSLTQGQEVTLGAIGSGVILLSADNGITGSFQSIQESFTQSRLLPFYFPNDLEVYFITPSFSALGNTANEKAIGADLDLVYLSPNMQTLVFALGTQSDAVSIRTAFDQISPSGFSVIYQAAFEDASLQGSEIEDRLAQLRDAQALPPPPSARRASLDEDARFAGNLSVADEMAMIVHPQAPSDGGGVWGGFFSGDGGHFIVGNSLNAPGFKSTSYGLPAAGVDYQISNQLALGIMVGYGESDISLNANGAITERGAQVGFYGTWHPTKAYLDLLVSGGLNQYSSQRQTYDGAVGGKTQGYEVNSRVTGGYDWKGRNWAMGPSLSAQWTHVTLSSFTEKGSIDSLTMPDQSQDSIMSLIGFHALGKIHIAGISFEPQAKASWEHEFAYQGGIIQAGFGQGDNFEVEGPSVGQDGFLVRGGLDTVFSPQFTISLGAQAELGRTNLQSNQFDGGMKFGF